ncbi:MAG: hypothetical protein JEZ03_06005 [Bacteroidales bacterium]|nr:hypothetical protein [Bacteroidales bacterium]
MDLISNPDELAQEIEVMLKSACWFWYTRKLNTYTDQDDVKSIAKRINSGYNGLEDRIQYLERAKGVFGISGQRDNECTYEIENKCKAVLFNDFVFKRLKI